MNSYLSTLCCYSLFERKMTLRFLLNLRRALRTLDLCYGCLSVQFWCTEKSARIMQVEKKEK